MNSEPGDQKKVLLDGRPKLALVGNAPVNYDLSKQIDGCDLVIRCNEAKNLGPFTGTKTDVLCVNNSGEPARRFISKKLLRKNPKFPMLSQVWFAREWGKISFDLSSEIIQANDLYDVTVKHFSKEIANIAYSQLNQHRHSDSLYPSTGFLAFCYILNEKEFENYDKYLFGFTFDIWYGHPAETEMKVIESQCRLRNDLYFVPADSYWKLKRIMRGYHIITWINRLKDRWKRNKR